MFLEMVNVNGLSVPRFQYLGTTVKDEESTPRQAILDSNDCVSEQQADKALSFLNLRAFFPQTTTVPATYPVRSGSNVLGCHVLRNHPDAGWVIYFHGNGELAAECSDYCGDLFVSAGINVCFVEYRGYGQSDGEPALAAMLMDGEQVVKALGVPPERIIAFGRSLGSIYAIELAHRLPGLAGLILESGVASLTDIWPIPDKKETPERTDATTALAVHFDHQAKLSKYHGPLLVLHAAGDHLVPQSHAERLYQWAAVTNKRLVILPKGNHNTILTANITSYVSEFERFVQRLGLGMPEQCR